MAQPTYALQLSDWTFSSPQAITDVTENEKGEFRMLRPATYELDVPTSGTVDAVTGIRTMDTTLQVFRNSTCRFNGILRHMRVRGDRNRAIATLKFQDPMIMWWNRRVRDATGKLALPVFSDPLTVGQFLFQALTNSQTFEGFPAGTNSSFLLSLGTDTTTANIAAALGNFPVPIGELSTLLGGSGMGEWEIVPSTGSAGIFGTLNVANRLGSNRSGSVQFDYGTGLNNCGEASYEEDAQAYCNSLNYWITKLDPEHWAARFNPFPGNSPPWPVPGVMTAIKNAILAARADHQVWLADRFFEDEDVGDPELEDSMTTTRQVYRRMWQLEASLRVRPKRLAFALPDPGGPHPWDDFGYGDKVSMNLAGLGVPGIEGVQRVYGWNVLPGKDGVERLGGIMTSPDGGEVLM